MMSGQVEDAEPRGFMLRGDIPDAREINVGRVKWPIGHCDGFL